VAHNRGEIERVADRVGYMAGGRIASIECAAGTRDQ
jgi:ABC-type sulfate/molybdate transport systems ATPase subunit